MIAVQYTCVAVLHTTYSVINSLSEAAGDVGAPRAVCDVEDIEQVLNTPEKVVCKTTESSLDRSLKLTRVTVLPPQQRSTAAGYDVVCESMGAGLL